MIYNVIEVFTREDVRWKGRLLSDAIVDYIRGRRIAARVIVSKGIAGCYENGEVSTHTILDLSYNMPLKIEIILPGPELETVLTTVEEMVTDGIVVVETMEIRSYKSAKRLLPQYLKVKDVMVGKPLTISPNQTLSGIVHQMLSEGLKWIPIVGPENRVQGIIAQKELVNAGMPISLGLAASMDVRQVETKVGQLPQKKAQDLMARPAVTVKEEQYLPEAVRIMLKKNLKRLPVVNLTR
jgi:PII-like signaling protein